METASLASIVKTNSTSCILCGEFYTSKIFSHVYKRVEYQIVRCEQCGFIYTNPRFLLEDIGNFYRDPIKSDRGVTIGLRADPCVTPRVGFRNRYMKFYDDLAKEGDKTVLDYVCRDGSFLEMLRDRYGWANLYGLEIRPLLAKITEDKGFIAGNTIVEKAGYPDKLFDVVVLRHYLEHLYEPHSSLKEIHRILKDEGYLRIEVPNINSLSRIISGEKWDGYYIPWHLYYYSKDTLRRLLNDDGFEIVSMATLPYPHFMISPLRHLRFLIRNHKARKIVGKTLDDSVLLGYLLYLPNLISVLLGMGDEIQVICRKK